MQFFTAVALALALATVNVSAIPMRARQLGSGFVTSPCTQDSDCQQGCCAFTTGLCAGPAIAQENADGGCGHGQPAPTCDVSNALGLGCIAGGQRGTLSNDQITTAANFVKQLDGISNGITLPSAPPAAVGGSSSAASSSSSNDASSGSAATSSSSDAPLGSSVVTDPCTTDADCQQGCCAFTTGLCAGPDVAQENADGGCGFGQPTPNCQVANALGLSGCKGNTQGVLNPTQLSTAVHFVAQLDDLTIPASFSG